ncbi:MAG TPA: isocitrate lyase/phosphoenolpyruvate mutase family protein [Edaphocola sp.]|nr:isocitrate lyase/phosphoenolpyruvate mutase family protein [Edaphocola sp.]
MIEKNTQKQRFETFKALHYNKQPLLLPNIWDTLSAGLIQDLGYEAIATSSSALALSKGYKDGQEMAFEELLSQLRSIARIIHLPITVDLENGFAKTDEELIQNIKALLDIGIVGINYEDSNKPENKLIPIETQSERIKSIKNIAKKYGVDIFVNARIDTYIHGEGLSLEEKLEETINRGLAYKAAGADCIFPILITKEDHIKELITQLKMPVNIMTFPGIPSLVTLNNIGVARISLGGSFIKLAIKSLKEFAIQFKNLEGLETLFNNDVSSDYLNHLISSNESSTA